MVFAKANLAAVIHETGKDRNHAQVSENHLRVTETGRTSSVVLCDARQKIYSNLSIAIQPFTFNKDEFLSLEKVFISHFFPNQKSHIY